MWHPQLTHRLRTLLYAEPILKLRSLDIEKISGMHHYDSVTLAIYTLDRIIESMGLDDESSSDSIINALEPLMKEMDALAGVLPDAENHRQFARKIIDRLREHPSTEYTDFNEKGAIRRKLEFRIINERWISDERAALELTSEAINLFLNAFDFNIEDAQVALEAVTLEQIKRGHIEKAAASARDARFRSIQFKNKIEQILRDTQRDVSQMDWRESIPKTLEQALVHIEGRLQTEKYIGESARDRLTSFESDSNEAIQARAIVDLMDDCINRHGELLETLINSRRIFLEEQARQVFVMRPATVSLPNLRKDVLEQLFAAPKILTQMALDGIENDFQGAMSVLLGVRLPEIFSVRQEILWLLHQAREPQKMSLPSDKQIWDKEIIESPRYPFQTEQNEFLRLQQMPVQLSAVLGSITDSSPQKPQILEYITLAALQAFESETTVDWQSERTGTTFEYEGFWGDDLELNRKTPAAPEDLQD